jgi:hypothetical protein
MYKQYFKNDYCGNVARPNQSLKLTEPAVDDFAAREKIFKGMATSVARIVYMELAARRRSLAPVR